MKAFKREKIESLLKDLSGDFLQRIFHVSPLVTVTRCELGNNMSTAIVYVSVFPETEEKHVLLSAKRIRSDLHEYIENHSHMRTVPLLDIAIDKGEKNRQNIDRLSRIH